MRATWLFACFALLCFFVVGIIIPGCWAVFGELFVCVVGV